MAHVIIVSAQVLLLLTLGLWTLDFGTLDFGLDNYLIPMIESRKAASSPEMLSLSSAMLGR